MIQILPALARGEARRGRANSLLGALAFAVAAAFALSVLGGVHAFTQRAASPPPGLPAGAAGPYVMYAWVALALLVVPILALGGAAARLGLARRDVRLASLRLLGATPGQVSFLAITETLAQALAGAIGGLVLYAALLPIWTSLTFQGHRLTLAEMWPGAGIAALTLAGVVVLAGASALISLRRVAITPLGVVARHRSKGLSFLRIAALVAALLAWAVVTSGSMQAGIAIMIAALAGVLAAFNLVGSYLVWLFGRILLGAARAPGTLLAARRVLDDPKGTWRVVGGPSLACFVAVLLSVLPAVVPAGGSGADAAARMQLRDIQTGALLTVIIAFVLAAASAGITQVASVLDRRREYALAHLAGVPEHTLNQGRTRQLVTCLAFTAGGASLTASLVLLPFGLAGALVSPAPLAITAGCIAAGAALVLGASEAARPALRQVLASPEPRPD